jgi:hypothetical protein
MRFLHDRDGFGADITHIIICKGKIFHVVNVGLESIGGNRVTGG